MIRKPQRDEEGIGDRPRPSTAASMTSRKKPVARDTSVKPPTVKMRPIIGRARISPAASDENRARL